MKKTKFFLVLVLTLVVTIVLSSCKKDDTDPDPVTPTPNPNDLTIEKFTGTINGASVSYIIDGTNDYESMVGCSKLSDQDSSITIYQSHIGNETKDISISKGTLVSTNYTPDYAEFIAFIKIGSCVFSDEAANGIEIKWVDGQGNDWTTTGTSQVGSNFNFAIVNYQEIFGSNYAIFKATFNCKLHCGNSTISLTNGIYIGSFENM